MDSKSYISITSNGTESNNNNINSSSNNNQDAAMDSITNANINNLYVALDDRSVMDEKSNNTNILKRSENRSLSSSLRRLITITFNRNSSPSSASKKSRRLNKSHKNGTNKRSLMNNNTNSNKAGSTDSNNIINSASDFASGKQPRDKSNLYKHNANINNNDLNNNKRRHFTTTIGPVTATVTTTTTHSVHSKGFNSNIRSSLFSPRLYQQDNNLAKEKISRRLSQPQQVSNEVATTSKGSITTISLGDSISLSKHNQSTVNNNDNNSESVITSNSIEDGENLKKTQSLSKVQLTNCNTVGAATTATTTTTTTSNGVIVGEIDGKNYIDCPLCVFPMSEGSAPYLAGCRHRVCLECMQRYITTEINHSRLNITCPICSEPIHPNTIKDILQNEKYYLKYESFMLRRVLAAEPDARWCPAPDCGYVVLANGCASCPKLVCGREGCKTSFCYHCKQEWHPNQTCSAASIQRNKRQLSNAYNITELFESESTQTSSNNRKTSKSSQATSIKVDDIKECPVCASRIVKMNDGSCNHMTCSICETEFCWLCMKEISDLHYFSPSGCTFWGKKPWSRKKKLLWQLGMLIGAPICIILIAGIAVPAIVIGIPVWAARKLHNRLERKPFSRYRKNAIITGGVLLSFVVSPIISAVALAIGIPILLGYVYGVVPLSLCRSSGGCLSAAPSLEDIQNNLHRANIVTIPSSGTADSAAAAAAAAALVAASKLSTKDGISIDTAMSHKFGDPSIGETSIYLSNISLETNSIGHVTNVEREDRESASNAALAGSIISGQTAIDDGHSTKALAGSINSKESGYTLIPAEVHANNNVSSTLSSAVGANINNAIAASNSTAVYKASKITKPDNRVAVLATTNISSSQ